MSRPLTAVNDSRLERSENRWGWTNSHKQVKFPIFLGSPPPMLGKTSKKSCQIREPLVIKVISCDIIQRQSCYCQEVERSDSL